MRNSVKSAISQKLPFAINWLGLINGGAGRGPELAPPKESWLVQCVLMEHGGKTFEIPKGFGPEDRTVFLVLPVSAVQALKRCMEARVPDFRGDPNDIAGHFVNGDPVSLDKGAYFVLFNREKDPRNANSRQGGFSAFAQPQGRGIEVKGYDAYMLNEYRGGPASLAGFESLVQSKVKPWHEAVNVSTDEEQVKFLEQVFRPFSDLLVYALEDTYGNVLDPKIRREGLVKLGRMRPVDPAEVVNNSAPMAPQASAQTAPAPAPAQPAVNPFARAAAANRSNDGVDMRGISESPDTPVVRNSLSSDQDTANAMELVARARRESMRGGSVPRPTPSN
jgi:hypothetical protein